MALSPGSRLGSYEITSPIGAGGMGEVYRARDSKLGREVAIKVLPDAFAKDVGRLTRFRREAQFLATLNHPNIAAIYGIEESGDSLGLVLELIEGEDLGARLRRGAIPVAEAMGIARQIALALGEAHDKGIVHRDLKPANVKVTPDGKVKVLDFGLARACAANPDLVPSADAPSSATTQASPLTEEGLVHGTPAYMSPEQARGAVVDQRSDVWAFGCVLFEMLTGRRAFSGKSSSDIIAGILTLEPDWSALPDQTPQSVRRELRRCLQKDVKSRLRHIGDAILDLDDAGPGRAQSKEPLLPRGARIWGLLGGALVAGAAISALWLMRGGGGASPALSRTTITIPADLALDVGSAAMPLALSPDGTRLVYAARHNGISKLYLRALDRFEPIAMEGTEGARQPFFSPDGESVGFFADGGLKRVSVSGGPPVRICDVAGAWEGGKVRGGTWGPDGTIVFDPGEVGLMRVKATGGSPEPLTTRDKAMDGRDFSWPSFLPDGRGLVVNVNGLEQTGPHLAFLSLDTGVWRVLGRGDQPTYVGAGYIVFHASHVREGEVQAIAFDARRGESSGDAMSVVSGVFRAPAGGGLYLAVSQTGALVFAPGSLAHTLVKVTRSGARSPIFDDRRGFRFPRISPDGHRIAVTIDPRPSQIWVYDIERQSRQALTSTGHNIGAVWTRDGQRIAYSSGGRSVSRAADGHDAEETISQFEYPSDWTADGRLLVDRVTVREGIDIHLVTPGGAPAALIATPNSEKGGRLSHDGKWLAYSSDESGRWEVYVRPFPKTKDGKWLVSSSGGASPVWSRDGRELFFMSDATLMAAPMDNRGASLRPGNPVALFSGPFDTSQDKNFDVFPNGSGFVMIEADPDARPTRLNVVLNWAEELRQKRSAPGR